MVISGIYRECEITHPPERYQQKFPFFVIDFFPSSHSTTTNTQLNWRIIPLFSLHSQQFFSCLEIKNLIMILVEYCAKQFSNHSCRMQKLYKMTYYWFFHSYGNILYFNRMIQSTEDFCFSIFIVELKIFLFLRSAIHDSFLSVFICEAIIKSEGYMTERTDLRTACQTLLS